MSLPELRSRQPLIGLALAAVLGIFAADRLPVDPVWPLGFAAMLGVAAFVRPATLVCLLLTVAAFFSLHTLRFHAGAARALAREFSAGPRVVRATGIVWSEPEKPATWTRNVTCRFVLKVESLELRGGERAPDVLMNVAWAGAMPEYGDRVSLAGSAENIPPARNPGQFDSERHQQRQGIYSEIHARFSTDCSIASHGHGSRAQTFAFAARRWMKARLEADLADAPDAAALIGDVVLGMRGDTPDEMRTLFQRTGTIHLFVVSGLNIAMLATIAFYFLKPLGLPRAGLIAIVIALIAGYTLVTGLRTSSVRSAIMASLLLIAQIFDRRPIGFNSLAAAALGLLAWDTNELFTPGFQFSFVIVFVIIASAGRIQRRLQLLAQPDPFLPRPLWNWSVVCGTWFWARVCVMLGVVIASWLGSLLFTVGYFHLFSWSSMVANFLAVPLAFAVLALGIATLLGAAAAPVHACFLWMSVLFSNANWLCAKLLLWVLKISTLIPGGWQYVEVPRLSPAPACEFVALDMGEGAAVHLRSGGRDWLLDCGSTAGYDHTVLPYLRTRGVNWLDGLLLTHGDSHHIGGALGTLDDFRPGALVESPLRDRSSTRRTLHAELERRRIGKSIHWRGDVIRVGGAQVRVLFPPAGIVRSVADDKALVLQLECDGARVLFMADSGFFTEQWLLENERDLRSDVIVKGQHSKDISGTADFLARVQPQAVICSAEGFGVPVARLDQWERDTAARGIAVFRQDRCGAVLAEIRGGAIELRAFATGQTFRSRAR